MKAKLIFTICLTPLVIYAAISTLVSAGNWNDAGIWSAGNIADDISESVDMNNNIGEVVIQNLDSYTVSDVSMNNGNTITIDVGGSLILGSSTDIRNLVTSNDAILNINGNLEIWGNLDVNNNLILNVTGNVLVHEDVVLKNNATIDIQGGVTIEGDIDAGDFTEMNVDGTLDVTGSLTVGIDSNLGGSGTILIGGGCTGPTTFCSAGPLDNISPVISDCPSSFSISITGNTCNEIASWNEPTATDNDVVDSFVSTHSPGTLFNLGTTNVTYTATDAAGNSTTCSFDVIVNDETAPVISNCLSDITVSISGAGCTETVSWLEPTASANCNVNEFTSTHASGDVFNLGTTTVTYTATDDTGNSTTCSFDVIVNDDTAPVISNCLSDITVSISGAGCTETVS